MAEEKPRTIKDLPEDAQKMVTGAGPAIPRFVHRSGEVRGEDEEAPEKLVEEDDEEAKSKSAAAKKPGPPPVKHK